MATPSSCLAWRIPWTEEIDGLQSIGLQRVGHNWSDFAHTQIYKRRFVWEISSCDYGGWNKLQSAICKPDNQGSQLYISVQIQRPENQGVSGIKSHSLKAQESRAPMSEGRRRWSFSSERERIHLSFTFLFHLLPPMDWMIPTHFNKSSSLYSVS